MNENLEARFILQYNNTINEFIEKNFIHNDLFIDIISEKIHNISIQYLDLVDDSFGKIEYNLNTDEDICYSTWDEWWKDCRDVIIENIENDLIEIIHQETENKYVGLTKKFSDIIYLYLQETIDDEWNKIR